MVRFKLTHSLTLPLVQVFGDALGIQKSPDRSPFWMGFCKKIHSLTPRVAGTGEVTPIPVGSAISSEVQQLPPREVLDPQQSSKTTSDSGQKGFPGFSLDFFFG